MYDYIDTIDTLTLLAVFVCVLVATTAASLWSPAE